MHPVRPGDKRPLLKDRPHQATTDPQAIEEWWARWPEANAGLACGPSGLTVVDLDGNYGRLHEKALRVAALPASVENGGRVEMRHWARAQEVAERWRLHAHRLYGQVAELAVSPQAEIEDKVVDAIRRRQGTDKYPDGLTATDISRFIWGLGTLEVKQYADALVAAQLLAKHKPGRVERYFVPQPAPQPDGGREE